MIYGSGGSKSRLAKAAGAEPPGQMRDENLHAVVAGSTVRSQNVQNTSRPEHLWQLRSRKKSAHRCDVKHVSKSKCAKHLMFGPLLEVEMSKKCTLLRRTLLRRTLLRRTLLRRTLLMPRLLRREAHFEVKVCKAHHVQSTFGGWYVQKVYAVAVRSTFRSQNVQNTQHSDHFWTFT